MSKKIVYICDRCKKEFDSENRLETVIIPVIEPLVIKGGNDNKIIFTGKPCVTHTKKDLCFECSMIHKYLKEKSEIILAESWEKAKIEI